VTDRIDRRRVLRGALLTALACPLCRPAAAAEWGYDGAHAPKNWSKLSPEFGMCSTGTMQSPIDLRTTQLGAANSVTRAYQTMPLKLVNNGHTIEVIAAPGSSCTVDGERFELVQFHFHHPSEHLLAGKSKPLEIHFVHANAAKQLAVLGVFLEPGGQPLAALEPIWAAAPANAGPEREVPGVTITPERLFPTSARHFRYQGSLTTPPCSEGVTWVVYAEPSVVSRAQVQSFARLYAHNARPVQKLNRRALLVTD
jgi:carbonic anhydrase